jgi:hypothetical protein
MKYILNDYCILLEFYHEITGSDKKLLAIDYFLIAGKIIMSFRIVVQTN